MLAPDLFEKIGFIDEMVAVYNKYRPLFGDDCDRLAKAYMCEGKDFEEALDEIYAKAPQVNEYTANMIFILECMGYSYQIYKEKNISDEVFYKSMEDLTYKVRECKTLKGVYGTFVPKWYKGFLMGERFALGRLQYDLWEHREGNIEVNGFKVETGFKTVACHIPSGSPLTHEAVLDSFKQAYAFFSDRIKDGILLIECFSWLLFPDYQPIFKECAKNTYSFNNNFYIYETYPYEKFFDCWRVFNVEDYEGKIDELPENTRMQKGFKKYLQEKNVFGGGRGALLFDGEKILTRKEK